MKVNEFWLDPITDYTSKKGKSYFNSNFPATPETIERRIKDTYIWII